MENINESSSHDFELMVVISDDFCFHEELFPDELIPIVKLFEKDNGGKLRLIKIDKGRLFLHGNNESELMLRLDGENYVVARVEFEHQRCGFMKQLEKLISLLCEKNEDKQGIVIECVVTPEMEEYCNTHGYSIMPYHPDSFIKKLKSCNS